VQTWRKWATCLDLQKGELPKLLCIGWRRLASQGQGSLQQLKSAKEAINCETYCDDNSKREPTAGAFGPGFCYFLSTKGMIELLIHSVPSANNSKNEITDTKIIIGLLHAFSELLE